MTINLTLTTPEAISVTTDESENIIVTLSNAGVENFIELSDAPSSYTGQGSKFVAVKSDASGLEFVAPSGAGDMLASVYDPLSKNSNAFSCDNHVDGTTNKVYSSTDKTKLSGLHQVTVSATQPSTPSTGDIWIDIS